MAINNALAKTDWKLLSEQKGTLLQLLVSSNLTVETKLSLDGILNWIEAIQLAAEEDGFPVVWLGEK